MTTTAWKPVKDETPGFGCRYCHKLDDVEYSTWTSSDEAHEDIHYRCKACGKDWWIEGSDY